MNIRRAKEEDIDGINKLLYQVLMVHHNGRPDLFQANAKKYTDEELMEIMRDPAKPIFVVVDAAQNVCGYAFCIFQQQLSSIIILLQLIFAETFVKNP